MKRRTLALFAIIFCILFASSCSDLEGFSAGDQLSGNSLELFIQDLFNEENNSAEKEPSSEELEPEEAECYFVSGSGEVYHTRADCNYLKNSKNVISGTLADASAAGKTRLCSACSKASGEKEEGNDPALDEQTLKRTCYFVSGGSVWHYDENCSALSKSKEVICGIVEDAIAAGKTRACSKCKD